MPQPRKYKQYRAISDELMREWELDLPLFVSKTNAGIADEDTRNAIQSIADFLIKTIGEVRRMKGRLASMVSDNAVMRKELMKRKALVRGLCLYEKKRAYP